MRISSKALNLESKWSKSVNKVDKLYKNLGKKLSKVSKKNLDTETKFRTFKYKTKADIDTEYALNAEEKLESIKKAS